MRYAILLVLLCGCAKRDMTPWAAAHGLYALMSHKVVQKECPPECRCGGTGKVRSGDGLAMVDCGCPSTCRCKGGGSDKR